MKSIGITAGIGAGKSEVLKYLKNTYGAMIVEADKIGHELSEILHPIIRQEILYRLKRAEVEEEELFVVEAALLIEAGYKEFLDSIWYIYCPKGIRIDRLMKNRGLSYKQCIDIIDKQLSDGEFMRECDVVIDNSGELEALHKNIDRNLALDNR